MATRMEALKRALDKTEAPTGFDITVVIGRIAFGQDGELNPVEAAFLAIGRDAYHVADGEEREYTFDPSGNNEHFMRVLVAVPSITPAEAEEAETW